MRLPPLPILFLGDNPAGVGGLGRILRDLATHTSTLPEFRIGTLGRLGTYSRYLPFAQYSYYPTPDNSWGEGSLVDVWRDFAGDERGVVMTVWDATRLTWLGMPRTLPPSQLRDLLLSRPFSLWGYFPVDGVTPRGIVSALGAATVQGYDRVLAYSKFGAQALGTADWIPHGLDMDVWKPRSRAVGREWLNSKGQGKWRVCADDVLVGIVASNQPRKDWGLAAATCASLKQHYGAMFRAWWHTDMLERSHAWNMLALLDEFGLADSVILVCEEWTDKQMALAYSACNVTLAPGMEGFGYPAAESQACGTPVVTGAGHGGSEFITGAGGALVPPVGDRIEGPHCVMRHVHNPNDWATTAKSLIGDARQQQAVAESVSYLNWDTLFRGAWAKWLRAGLR